MFIKKNFLILIFILVSSLAFADVPIVDYSSGTNSDSKAKSSEFSEAITQPALPENKIDSSSEEVVRQPSSPTEPLFKAQDKKNDNIQFNNSQVDDTQQDNDLPIEQRVKKMQQQINNFNQQNFAKRIEELEQKIQKLNGQLEVQEHQLEQMSGQLRNFYQDLNKRITKDIHPDLTLLSDDKAKLTKTVAAAEDEKPEKPAKAAKAEKPAVQESTSITPASPKAHKDLISAPAAASAASSSHDLDTASLKEQQLYQTAIDLLPDRKYNDSAAKLRLYISTYPKGAYIANAYYWLGEIYFLQKKFNLASTQFKVVINKYASSKKVADAALKLALIHDAEGKHQLAMTELRQVKKRYPNTGAARDAARQLQLMGKD